MKAGRFDVAAFYAALDAQRRSRGITWKQVAAESKVAASTLTRMAQGKRPDVNGLAALCTWSGLSADDYVREEGSTSRGEPAPLAMISTHLRSDPNLTAKSAEMLEALIFAAYDQLKTKE
jgi:transcriptional regulator with XRE-family HTH domain